MNALFLKDLAQKMRRGLRGPDRGRQVGRRQRLWLRRRQDLDAEGEPVRASAEVDPTEAEIVREIFADYAAGARRARSRWT